MKGLEPPRLAALDPKSSASTNFATSACVFLKFSGCKYSTFFIWVLFFLERLFVAGRLRADCNFSRSESVTLSARRVFME